MRRWILTILIITLLTTTTFAQVSNALFSIKSYMPRSDGNLYIQFEQDPEGITFPHKWWDNHAYIEGTNDNYNAMVAAIISAFLTGQKLTTVHYTVENGVWANQNTNFVGYTFMKITTFRVVN